MNAFTIYAQLKKGTVVGQRRMDLKETDSYKDLTKLTSEKAL